MVPVTARLDYVAKNTKGKTCLQKHDFIASVINNLAFEERNSWIFLVIFAREMLCLYLLDTILITNPPHKMYFVVNK